MKCQSLFSEKIFINLLSALFAQFLCPFNRASVTLLAMYIYEGCSENMQTFRAPIFPCAATTHVIHERN